MYDLPPQVLRAISMLNAAGHRAYVVGGAVRELLRGKGTVTDFDLTTSARPEETEGVFAGFRLIETGLKHGTVTVLLDGLPLEITTFRVDGTYSDGRHPDGVSFTPSLERDLEPAGLHINAMAYHPPRGTHRPHGGPGGLKGGPHPAAWATRTGDFGRTACGCCGVCALPPSWAFASRSAPGRPWCAAGPLLDDIAHERVRES